MVAGYVAGQWPSYAGLVARFPHAVHVSIAVEASQDAQVLDCERFDATPAQCPAWAQRQRRRGQVPTVYCNSSTWPTVRAEFAAQGVALPLWWAAQYDGLAELVPGSIAKQYRGDVPPGYDVSIVADLWPGVDPPRPPTPAPTARKDRTMFVYKLEPATGGNVYLKTENGVEGPFSASDAVSILESIGQPVPGGLANLHPISPDGHVKLGGKL
jgi:hypothetical protein